MRSELNIIRRDWIEFKRPILLFTGGMLTPLLFAGQAIDFLTGLTVGLVAGASFGLAQIVFHTERQRGTLELLLGLPIRPFHLILAKYLSQYSMILFVVNAPAALVGNTERLLYINASGLFLATLCMGFRVLSDKPWAPQLPVYLVIFFVIPVHRIVEWAWPGGAVYLDRLQAYPHFIAAALVCSTPLLAAASALHFERQTWK
jgi:hypothetical protein